MKKRFLSLFLSVVIALSVFSVLPITASGEETQNTYTVAGETTGYVSDGVATGKAVSEVKTHSIVGTIAPDGWNPQGEANLMTLNGDTYEFEITGVKADTYTFKITTNGQWDPAYDFDGKIASGGSDETIIVPENNSTVKFTFKEKEGFVRAYINGVDYLSGFNTYNTPHTTSKGGYYIPYEGVKTYRYFFEMPESWKTFANATACCYWSEGTDNCDKVSKVDPDFNRDNRKGWNYSYMMRKADVPNKDNIYFIDVPQDVHHIEFNNGIDTGMVIYDDNGNETYKNYGKACQTNEETVFLNETVSYNNMIFVVNQDDVFDNSYSGKIVYGGEWKYLHKDGTINSTKGTIFEQETPIWEKALAKNIEVYPYSDSVYIGKKITLEAVVFPTNADRRVTWKSSDTKVATVDSNGVVTGKSMGEVTISATTTDGTNLVDTCVVTVKDETTDFIKCLNYKVNEDKKSITITNYSNNYDYDFKDIVIPKTIDGYTVTDIGELAFAYESFNTVKFSEGLKTIGDNAFYSTEISSIYIPKSVTSIGEHAIGFYRGYYGEDDMDSYFGIYNITFYAYRGSAGWNYAKNHFALFDKDERLEGMNDFVLFRMGYEKTVTNNGFKYNLYNDGTADLIKYTGKASNVTVPSKVSNHTVISICKKTFSDNDNRKILSITIPNTVKYIDKYSMLFCDSLKKVVIPKSVKNLEYLSVGGGKENDEFDPDDVVYDLMRNFTIYGYKGSDAEKYAKQYHINFIDMGTSISFKKNPVTIYKTGTYTIKPIVKYGKGTTTYKSDNTKVATVNGKGVVTAKKVGKAKITVTNNGVKKVLKVTVKNPYLNKIPKTLKLGKNFTLKINGQVGKAKFTHSKKDIVSVNPIKGKSNQYKVTAKKKGTTTITIKTNGITLKCKVTVI
ncbi:MAG: Ig-like domain-containing protein [Ruminococcus sp.]|nr:Ig-like domain-containing protein [Ruminococcus sp.]